jgi:hypothetical protein
VPPTRPVRKNTSAVAARALRVLAGDMPRVVPDQRVART